jgi:hypothetical protein
MWHNSYPIGERKERNEDVKVIKGRKKGVEG